MPSPPGEDIQLKRETTGQDSSETVTPQPPATPQPLPQPPGNHILPCPPVMGYPGYPNPYPSYPNGPYNNHYAAQAPPATYYRSSLSPYPAQQYPDQRRSSASTGFFRGILTGLIMLFAIFCLLTIISGLVLQPQIPVFSVTRFSVSGFNATQPVFAAQWTANFTVENPNTKLKAYFNRIQVFIYHQNSLGHDVFLATGFIPPVYVDTKKTAEIGQTLTAGEKEKPTVTGWATEEMKTEWESGTVSFNLRMKVWVTLRAEGWWARESRLNVFCEKLKVGFQGRSGNGAVLLSEPLSCLVSL